MIPKRRSWCIHDLPVIPHWVFPSLLLICVHLRNLRTIIRIVPVTLYLTPHAPVPNRPAPNHRRLFKGRCSRPAARPMTPNFPAPACMHPSPVAALALRPSGACQRHQSPTHPPGHRRGRAHRRSLGWAVGLVSPASFCIKGVLGSFPLILGSERVRIWAIDCF